VLAARSHAFLRLGLAFALTYAEHRRWGVILLEFCSLHVSLFRWPGTSRLLSRFLLPCDFSPFSPNTFLFL